MKKPRRSNRATMLIALASAVGVGSLALTQLEQAAPGPISAVHAGIEELEGGQNCAACHGGWFGDMQQACTTCHEEITEQLANGTGLHGTVDGDGGHCSDCHGEHHGPDFQLVNRLAFAQAGVGERDQFDHGRVGVEFDGAHLDLKCEECHEHADTAVLASGQKRFLGLDRSCQSCHEDRHEGAMQLHCTTCHDQNRFDLRNVDGHDRFVALTDAHADVDCRECHVAGTRHALEAMSATAHRLSRGCADCHESPHRQPFLIGNAALAELAVNESCAACHALAHQTFAAAEVTVTPTQHAHTGFGLQAPHADVDCSSCHDRVAPYAARHPARGPDDCHACHSDPHGDQFVGGPFGGEGCLACHEREHFAPHAFDLERHTRTTMPLEGSHAELECRSCHADPVAEQPRQFAGTPVRCEQCHTDGHHGSFAAQAAQLEANPHGTCAECHQPTAFADLDHEAFDHTTWAGFVVDGAHGQVDCVECHRRAEVADEVGRRFGRVTPAGETFLGCAQCHDDPHRGRFDGGSMPSEIDGHTGCERCHGTASFRALPRGFDHGCFTPFELAGRHAEVPCSQCHVATAAAPQPGQLTYPPRGKLCAECHGDPHQGQFDRLGGTDCRRCHKSTVTFRTVTFRHNLDSRFPLGEAHARLSCAACHQPQTIRGQNAVRYKPLPVGCADCHGSDQGGAPKRR